MGEDAKQPWTAVAKGVTGSPSASPGNPVGLESWDIGPHNRWAFQNMSALLPTAEISRGCGQPIPLEPAAVDLSPVRVATPAGGSASLTELLQATHTDGIVVLKDGKLAHESYFNGMREDTKHLLMSVSKSLTGALVGVLVDSRKLKPEASVTDYVPELAQGAYADATVRDLLDMTVSVVFREAYGDPQAEITRYDQASGWRGSNDLSRAGAHHYLTTLKKDARPHGVRFQYASANTDVLAWLIERASGQRYAKLLGDRIWSRLGAEHGAYITVDALGGAIASGGICATARDLARFAQMMLDNGHINGSQVISPDWLADIRFGGNNAAWRDHAFAELFGYPGGCYRNQWYATNNHHGAFFGIGVHGQLLWIDPTARVVIAKLSSQPAPMDPDMIRADFSAAEAVSRCLASL